MHQDDFAFPDGERDWEALGLMPIGIVRRGEGDDWRALALDDQRVAFMVDGNEATPLDREEVGPAIFQVGWRFHHVHYDVDSGKEISADVRQNGPWLGIGVDF